IVPALPLSPFPGSTSAKIPDVVFGIIPSMSISEALTKILQRVRVMLVIFLSKLQISTLMVLFQTLHPGF
ncbi:MAG: hypothetical protein AAFY76_09695, partial [Cyanobacteria bacterium J06649_11]